VIACRVLFARVPDRVPPFRLGALALALAAIGLVGLSQLQVPAAVLVSAAVLGIGVAFITPAMFSAVVARVEPGERGSALGTASVFIDIGLGGGPILVGLVAGVATISAGFAAAAAVAGVGALVALISGRRQGATALS